MSTDDEAPELSQSYMEINEDLGPLLEVLEVPEEMKELDVDRTKECDKEGGA